MPTRPTSAAIKAAKAAMRSQCLKELRQWARANPDALQSDSQRLCDKLYTHVAKKYLRPPPVLAGAVSSSSHPPPLYVCAYLPLYYEVDLVPFMERLWAAQDDHTRATAAAAASVAAEPSRSPSHSSRDARRPAEVVLLVPIVLEPPQATAPEKTSPSTATAASRDGAPAHAPPDAREWHRPHDSARERLRSALMFVEVHDAADLQKAFAVTGKYRIRELKEAVLGGLLVRRPQGESISDAEGTVDEEALPGRRASPPPHRPRRVLCCDDWEKLFPEHAPPPGLIRLPAPGAPPSLTPEAPTGKGESGPSPACCANIVVLAPGVRFRRSTGARLGKGGGFYDRFLTYLRARASHAGERCGGEGPQEEATNRSRCFSVEVIGIALDSQVTDEEVAADAATDIPVDSVMSPSRGLETATSTLQ